MLFIHRARVYYDDDMTPITAGRVVLALILR